MLNFFCHRSESLGTGRNYNCQVSLHFLNISVHAKSSLFGYSDPKKTNHKIALFVFDSSEHN